MSAIGRKRTLADGHFCEINTETPTDLPHPASYAARMDDDREAYEFAYAQVDKILQAAIRPTALKALCVFPELPSPSSRSPKYQEYRSGYDSLDSD